MTTSHLATIAAAACVLVVSACGADRIDTAARTSTSSSIEPKPCPNAHGGLCLGDLDPGTYETIAFRPSLEYTVPAGWTNREDLTGNFLLHLQQDEQSGYRGGSYLGIYQDVRAAALDCGETWQRGVRSKPAALVAWFRSIPGLEVSAPRGVRVGGLRGLQIDITLKPDGGTCTYEESDGTPLIIGSGVSQLHHVVLDELDVRLVILAWRGGNVTLEITNTREQHTATQYRDLLQPILDSLRFRR